MILYLDTSALVKLYVEETGTVSVQQLVDAASVVSTSVVAYAEARSAFARQHREGGLGKHQLRQATLALDQHWPRLLAVEATEDLCRRAGDLAEAHALRGFDSLHLASFLLVATSAAPEPVRFSCFDERLEAAARTAIAQPAVG